MLIRRPFIERSLPPSLPLSVMDGQIPDTQLQSGTSHLLISGRGLTVSLFQMKAQELPFLF